jgi:hypothetical protein
VFILTFALIVVAPMKTFAAAIPEISKDANPFQVREEVRLAGWRIPRKPWCKPDESSMCAIRMTKEYLRVLPEISDAAGDRPYVNTCYNDGVGNSLIVTFRYVDRQGSFEHIAAYRMNGWRIEDKSCEKL